VPSRGGSRYGFSAISETVTTDMKKQRHHYVPKAYLNPFCDEVGRVRVYLKDDPQKCIHQSPENVGFHKYYYSQPLPEGGHDHNTLEDAFSEIEEKWPPLVYRIGQRADITDSLADLIAFMSLQRVRVPATRNACEKAAAETVVSTLRVMDARGGLSPKPTGHEDVLDHIEVAIDPQRSIHGMRNMLAGIDRVFDQIGICALHNMTDTPFLTSDNPVVWFDPSVPEAEIRPYVLQPDGPMVLLFPVAPSLMIYGHSSMREQFVFSGFGHGDLADRDRVIMINRQICRFAYKAVFAQKLGQESLILEHADVSPVLQTLPFPVDQGEVVFYQFAFGARKRKAEWGQTGLD
jgi:hypothetical protein